MRQRSPLVQIGRYAVAERNSLDEAASLTGQSVDAFVLTALLDRAREVAETGSTRVLSLRDAVCFVEWLDAEPEPNDACAERPSAIGAVLNGRRA